MIKRSVAGTLLSTIRWRKCPKRIGLLRNVRRESGQQWYVPVFKHVLVLIDGQIITYKMRLSTLIFLNL